MIRKQARQTMVASVKREPALSFSPLDILNALGLDGARHSNDATAADGLASVYLGDGTWDERSGGAIAVKTRAGLDEQNRLRRLDVDYLCLQPDGSASTHKLCEIDIRLAGAKLKLHTINILGRPVAVGHAEQVARVLGFLQRLHADMRNLRFPGIAKIMHEFQIPAMLGEQLALPGSSPDGGFSFSVLTSPTASPDQPFVLPRDFSAELMGCGANDLDMGRAFGSARSQIGTHPKNGELFRFSAALNAKRLHADTKPLAPTVNTAISGLIDLSWHEGSNTDLAVDRFLLRGEPSHDLPSAVRQQRLGVVNLAVKDLRAGNYPSLPDHLARYNQHDLMDQAALTSALDRFPQMVVVPFGGHNDREYLPGLGGTIGGNSKGVFAHWRDAQGRARRKGVLIDYGIVFSKKNGIHAGEHGNWDYVLPDVSAWLRDFDDILLTHPHADHMQGIVDLAKCRMVADKTVHASIYDCRVLTQFLKKANVPESDWPKLNALHGEGWIDVKDGDQKVLSVFYSTNAIPHSTNVTAFALAPPPVIGDADGNVLPNPHYWSYANLGDMSFGPYNAPGYKGEKPPDTGFKRDFFANFKAGLRERFPDLPAKMRRIVDRVHVVEIDPTSIHRKGWAPDVVTAEKNWRRLHGWFTDKGIIAPNLSTAKRAHEMMFRVAVETGRHVSAEGAYIEDRLRDMNIEGVNIDVLSKQGGGGEIQNYLDWHAGVKGLESVTHLGRTAKKWHEIVETTPHRTLILATGSQGSEIEKDSVGTQAAEGWSRFQLDPKYCRAAYGVDLKDFMFVYPQGAIPGHEDEQLAQLRKTAFDNDLMVAAAVHNGTRFFNLKEPHLSRITDDLERTGDKYTREPNGGLYIHGFSLYVPGHGWEEDFRHFFQWFRDNGVYSIWVQHFSRHESVRLSYALADEAGLKHPPEPTPNRVICTMKDGKDFTVTARLTPSFILARNNRRADKYHNGTNEYKQAVFRIDETGTEDNGLFVANDNAVFFRDFGAADYDRTKHEATLPPVRSRRDFDPEMTRRPFHVGRREFLPTRGPVNPLRRPPAPHILAAGVR